ncbi:sensor histidine kinase [Pedobacter duraquae]|uniref:histidine kinase n=1 Tax=Pedobacter duraquae TaxID=425511 RepID=A0A4R6IH53_9SPHI|nr:HAMP domain-containing sensor histidine kinase [Pedobacter duraquae]TDO21484.1 two-component system phosphate regulon sensor histidine kinase PhoR [Pedobacter duraquae]
MKKRGFWFITGLMSLALLGVVVMQLYYIKQAYSLNSQLFEQNVNQVLSNVVNKIQANNAFSHYNDKNNEWRYRREKGHERQIRTIAELKEKQIKENADRRIAQQKRIVDDLNFQDSVIRAEYRNPSIIPEDKFIALGSQTTTPLNLDVEFKLDDDMNMVSGKIRNSFKAEVGKTFSMRPNSLPDTIRYLAYSLTDGQPLKISLASVDGALEAKFRSEDVIAARRHEQELRQLEADTVSSYSSQIGLVEAAAKEVANAKEPLSRRISKDKLDTLIKKELLNKNITLNYDFWVKEANRDTVLYRKAANISGDVLPSNTYKTTIFNRDVRRDPGMLYLSFPDQQSAIFGNMSATLASSGILLLVLIVIFSYTLYTILRQKKISEMKTDFINNMTHEFKTPVATIMIASEALKDPEIVEDKSRIKRLAGIIYDENVRLGNHIERVLSIARLEKRELHMERTEVHINELVSAVMDSMQLQLQKKDASIKMELQADPDIVIGDELHLSNVIYNLIDNANKYSVTNPQITVKTRSTNRSLIIEVADEGIGMTKEQSKRIFDQFYRVPTGNLHDVKGFGLGLNYVQDVLLQMDGTVKVQSEKDKGTLFIITLPLHK